MAIKKQELDETEEARKAREEKEAEEKQQLELQREEQEESRRKELEEAKIARARAEGELEAAKRNITAQPQNTQTWTKEQWEAEAEKYGYSSGEQLRNSIAIADGIADRKTKSLQDEIEKLRKENAETREETNRLKSHKTLESVEQNFYNKNPALRMHKDQVDKFLDSYPDRDRIDDKKLSERLSMAADLVKGRVKDMRTNRTGETGSSRFEETEETERKPWDIGEFDSKGTGNEGAAHLMRQIHDSFGKNPDLKHEDSVEVWKSSLDEEGRGVSLSMDEDIARYRRMRDREAVGGRRG